MVYWLASFWHCTSMKWIPPEDERRLSDESVEVWHTSRHSHRLSASVWSYFNGEVCDPSAAMGQCFVAFLGSLRCLVDCGAKSCKPMGVRFIGSDSCRKSVASMNQLGRISNIGRLFLLYFPQPQLKQCEMYDCMMRSPQYWSNDMHRLRPCQDEAHLVDPPTKTNRRTGGVCGAPVMVPTLDHSALTVAELIHSKALIDLLWIVSCLSTLSAKVQISSKIIKYQDPNGLLIDRLQRLYCRCGRLRLGSWKRGVDQWNNPSSTIPPEFDSTKRSLHRLDTVYLCRWVLVVRLVT